MLDCDQSKIQLQVTYSFRNKYASSFIKEDSFLWTDELKTQFIHNFVILQLKLFFTYNSPDYEIFLSATESQFADELAMNV